MITTNLTLTNGATSEVPVQVEGITFEVDSKLAVNPSVVFPLTVAIDSSEIIGIDFDETLYTGDYTESITINTLGGRHDIVHVVTIDDLTPTVDEYKVTYASASKQDEEFWIAGIMDLDDVTPQPILNINGLDNGVTLTILDGLTGSVEVVGTGDNSGFIRDYQFEHNGYVSVGDILTTTIGGLNNDSTYKIRIAASRDINENRNTIISLNGVEQSIPACTLDGGANYTDGAEYLSIVPTNGEITFTATGDGVTGYVCGFDVIEDTESFKFIDGTSYFLDGKVHRQADIQSWQKLLAEGVFVLKGDTYTESTGDYDAANNGAIRMDETPDSEYITIGTNLPLDKDDPLTYLSGSEFNHLDDVMKASFIDLVEGTLGYQAQVKAILLAQVQEPTMDFTNSTLYPPDSMYESFWLYAEWAQSLLVTYDYVDTTTWTNEEKLLVDNWLLGAGELFYTLANDRHYLDVYIHHDIEPSLSVADIESYRYDSPTVPYKGALPFYAPAFWISNRIAGIVQFVTMVGVKYDLDNHKDIGVRFVREFIAFYFGQDGYFAELNRCIEDNPNYGLAYLGNTYINIAEISNVLYMSGYNDLYSYTTTADCSRVDGSIIVGSVTKSLEWTLLQVKALFLDADAPAIYVEGTTIEDSTTIIHYGKNTDVDAMSRFGRIKSGIYFINMKLDNSTITEIYTGEYGNMLGFSDSDLEMRGGPNGLKPAYFFQYSKPIKYP